MQKPTHWKQPTPAMQLIALRGSYEGRVDNFCDCPGEIDGHVLASMADEFVEDLKTLQPFLELGAWSKEELLNKYVDMNAKELRDTILGPLL